MSLQINKYKYHSKRISQSNLGDLQWRFIVQKMSAFQNGYLASINKNKLSSHCLCLNDNIDVDNHPNRGFVPQVQASENFIMWFILSSCKCELFRKSIYKWKCLTFCSYLRSRIYRNLCLPNPLAFGLKIIRLKYFNLHSARIFLGQIREIII